MSTALVPIEHYEQNKKDQRDARKRAAFLASLAVCANVCRACEDAHLSRMTAYYWRNNDSEFKRQWDDCLELGTDALEDEAIRRAAEGTLEPVFQGGQCVGHVRKFSDTLLIFMLKARRPAKFKDRAHLEVTGKNGQPIDIRMSAEQFKQLPLDERIRIMQSAMGSPASN